MDDRTAIERPAAAAGRGLAYVFWTGGEERGSWVRLDPAGMTFGTSAACEAPIRDAAAAPEQARIRKEEDQWFLYDLEGRDTTCVDGEAVYRQGLKDGSVVTLGATTGIVRILEGDR